MTTMHSAELTAEELAALEDEAFAWHSRIVGDGLSDDEARARRLARRARRQAEPARCTS